MTTDTVALQRSVAACLARSNDFDIKQLRFLHDVDTQLRRGERPLTEKQVAWLENLALDFERIGSTALSVLESLCRRWLPGGCVKGHEYVARNPNRSDQHPGSFRVNLNTGAWADFAVANARGGDAISLGAYIARISNAEAAKNLASMLGVSNG
jgi:hypothetical protein